MEFEKSCREGGNRCESWLPSCFIGKLVYKRFYHSTTYGVNCVLHLGVRLVFLFVREIFGCYHLFWYIRSGGRQCPFEFLKYFPSYFPMNIAWWSGGTLVSLWTSPKLSSYVPTDILSLNFSTLTQGLFQKLQELPSIAKKSNGLEEGGSYIHCHDGLARAWDELPN